MQNTNSIGQNLLYIGRWKAAAEITKKLPRNRMKSNIFAKIMELLVQPGANQYKIQIRLARLAPWPGWHSLFLATVGR